MDAIKRSLRELAAMNQFDSEALQSELFKNIKPDPETGTVDINWPLVTKGGDQIELSGGWGGNTFVATVGVSFNNFSTRSIGRYVS